MPISIRATLSPYYHPKRRKWYPRGTFPVKDAQGNVTRKRDYRGTASDTRVACQTDCDRLNRELEQEAASGRQAPTFEEAAAAFLELGGDGRYLTERLLDEIGHLRCDMIDDLVVIRAKGILYPTCVSATLNRQLYTPIISVLRNASKGQGWKPDLSRPKGYWKLKPAKSPPTPWFDAVLPHCSQQMSALLLCCTLHGVRGGNLIRLKPDAFSPEARTVMIDKDKNGDPVLIKLASPVFDAIQSYNWEAGPGLFGTLTWENRRGAYRQLETACKRAGVPYYPLHKAGRHAFAKRLLDSGKSLAHVKAAGRWTTMRVVGELYGHYEHSEVDEATREIGEKWARNLPGSASDNVVDLKSKIA